MKPIVSIIVPVYNVEKYLERCLDSILSQTYDDFELILVDDGSTDSSGGICDNYVSKDARIKVYHQTNLGVSAARNQGLDIAIGEFILFIDSDDYIDGDYIKSFIDIQRKSGADWIIEGYKDGPDIPNAVVYKKDYGQLFSHFNITSRKGCYLKLYSRELIEKFNVKFEIGVGIGEDFLFNLGYLMVTKKIVMVNEKLYNRVARAGSLSSTFRDPNEGFLALKAFMTSALKVERELKLKGEEKRALYKESLLYLEKLLGYILHLPSFNDRMNYFRKVDLTLYDQYKQPSSFKERLLVFCIKHRCFYLYDTLNRLERIKRKAIGRIK